MNRCRSQIAAIAKNMLAAATISCALTVTQPCLASTTIDPPDDLLDTYIGPVGPDLDILQFSVTRDAANFFISAVLGGVPGTTNSRYSVGVDRGAGTYHLGAGIRPDILFDTAINLFPLGQVTFIGPPDIITPLPSGAVSIDGNTISAIVPISMLPSLGLDPNDYKFYLWSRTPVTAPTPPYYGIADFAGTGPLTATAVPEPATWGLMLFGFGLIGAAIRRRAPNLITHAVRRSA
jgi:hypothetical protein